MLCNIEVQDAPTIVTDDEKAIEHAEGDRRNTEEVHRSNRFPVITEKGKPALDWLRISRCPFHPTRDRSLRNIKTEHKKLAMNAWRSPRWVLNNHPENQFPNFLRCLSSPCGSPDLGKQLISVGLSKRLRRSKTSLPPFSISFLTDGAVRCSLVEPMASA